MSRYQSVDPTEAAKIGAEIARNDPDVGVRCTASMLVPWKPMTAKQNRKVVFIVAIVSVKYYCSNVRQRHKQSAVWPIIPRTLSSSQSMVLYNLYSRRWKSKSSRRKQHMH